MNYKNNQYIPDYKIWKQKKKKQKEELTEPCYRET